MKSTRKIINTIPDGAWEAGQTNESLRSCHKNGSGSAAANTGQPPKEGESVEPLPESARPRKDGPGGN